MAKSTRSKVKRSFRAKKRQSGVYAATEAARLQRLNSKLQTTMKKDKDGDVELDDLEIEEENAQDPAVSTDAIVEAGSMEVDSLQTQPKRISTHGPRGSRREEWRKSKGMTPRPSPQGMNRQGGIAARRKAGRSKRRR